MSWLIGSYARLAAPGMLGKGGKGQGEPHGEELEEYTFLCKTKIDLVAEDGILL